MLRRVGGILLTALGLTACRESKPGVVIRIPPPDSAGVYHVTADELFDAYRQDSSAAAKLLRGKTAVVRGYIVPRWSDIEVPERKPVDGTIPQPNLYLHVEQKSNGFWISPDGVICLFPEQARDELRRWAKTLEDRQNISVRGQIGTKFGSVFVENCALEK